MIAYEKNVSQDLWILIRFKKKKKNAYIQTEQCLEKVQMYSKRCCVVLNKISFFQMQISITKL